jgi:hypothetical protein
MKAKISAALAAMFAASCLTGCVSVFEGTSQDISVVTNPTGAHCAFKRDDGRDMGTIERTPGRLTVRKSKYDLTITCTKAGYQEAAYVNHSGTSATIAANVAVDILFTAGISSIVDSADGADNKYDSVVNISMIPELQQPVAKSAALQSGSSAEGAGLAQPISTGGCTHQQEVDARIAKMNGYVGGPKCD